MGMFLPLPGRLFRRSEKQTFLFVLNELLFVQYFFSNSFLLFVVYSS